MAATAGTAAATVQAAEPLGTRRRRRRTAVSKWARPVYPIKAIWDAASEEEKAKARGLTSELLGYWLGQQSKTELARQLGVPPIRVWQISQRAVAGMVAALLRPPSGRRGAMPKLDPEVKGLRKRIAVLEHENELQRRLIRLLRTMPGNETRELPKDQVPKEERDAKPTRRKKKAVEQRGREPGPGTAPGT